MGHHSEAFIGVDTAKLRNAVAVAEAGRTGDLRYLGEVDTSEAATRKVVAQLAGKYGKLTFCYEAGPTGYGLQRLIASLGHTCLVVAPSLIPKKPGDRVKTNRRDAEGLARLLRAGELTSVWVPDARHEAMRELTRARDASKQDLTRKRQQVSSMMLRLGLLYPGIKTWNARHRSWLANLKLAHPEQRFVLEEMLQAERQTGERVGRLEQAIRDALADWSLGPIVPALMAMRGIDTIAAVTILAETGDLSRFESPRQLMAYLGLVPSERSTGESVKRGSITKAGNGRARRVLVEAAWAYRQPPRVGVEKQVLVAAAPKPAREIAWKAQVRLCKRFRKLSKAGKKSTVVVTAIARELAAFIWAIAREVAPTPLAGTKSAGVA
jgi:transposase